MAGPGCFGYRALAAMTPLLLWGPKAAPRLSEVCAILHWPSPEGTCQRHNIYIYIYIYIFVYLFIFIF